MSKNLYAEVTYPILTQLEAGTPPWTKESRAIRRGNIPMNAVTTRPYSGGNIIFLWAHAYAVQRFLTFKQVLNAGGSVRRGEHGVRVYFVSKVEKATGDGEKPNLIPFLKEYTVFNVARCHGLPEEYLNGGAKAINLNERYAEAQEFIAITGANFREGRARRTTRSARTLFRCRISTPSRCGLFLRRQFSRTRSLDVS